MRAKNIFGWVMGLLMMLLPAAGPAMAGDPVMSLQPLHPGREIVLEAAFEGEWVMADLNLKLSIARSKDFFTGKPFDYYTLVLTGTNDNELMSFDVHLVRLGSVVFADIQQTTETGLFALYPHVFAKIRVEQDELVFDFLDKNYLRGALENGRTDLKHEQPDGTFVLTAPTRELQDFVESNAYDDEAFGEHVSFTRLKAKPGDSK